MNFLLSFLAIVWLPCLVFFSISRQGLVVPVIRNVEEMNYADIEKAINALGEKVLSLIKCQMIKTDSVQSSSNYLQKLFSKNLLTAR